MSIQKVNCVYEQNFSISEHNEKLRGISYVILSKHFRVDEISWKVDETPIVQ